MSQELFDEMMAHIKACQQAMEMEVASGSSASTHGLGFLTATAAKLPEPPPITLEIFDQIVKKSREYSRPLTPPKVEMTIPLTLTLEGQRWRDSLFIPQSAIRIIEVEPTPIYKQARTHRKIRINKKWRKRYGTKLAGFDYFLGDQVLMDERRGTGYCHPETARIIRQRIDQQPRFTS